MPGDARRLRLHGRADEAQFAQNPLPVVEAMGEALAAWHGGQTSSLTPRTPMEIRNALALLDEESAVIPSPYERVSRPTLRTALSSGPPANSAAVCTHGAPIVAAAFLDRGVLRWDTPSEPGLDPAERDLAIALRSIAETFSPEATRTFIDAYTTYGGQLPDAATLDWYALLAAFR